MKCPICNHELDIKNKKTGETENGEAIYNEFAICHDCKKQWNLDKQRAKAAAKSEVPASEAPAPKRKKRRPASAAESIEKPITKKPRPVSEPSEAGRDSAAPESPRPKKKKRPAPRPADGTAKADAPVNAEAPQKAVKPEKPETPKKRVNTEEAEASIEPVSTENSEAPKKRAATENSEAPKKRINTEDSAQRPRKKRRPAPKPEGTEAVRPAFGDEPEDKEAPARPRPKKKRPAALSEDSLSAEPVKTERPAPKPKKVRPVSPKAEEPAEDFIDTFDDDFEERPKVKRRRAIDNTEDEITYSNIPPKHIRDVREQEMRDSYQTMLNEGEEEWEDEDRRFPVWLIVIIVLILLAAAAFAGYWFLIR